jgi:hypothetical protein
MLFYLGTHETSWLARTAVPLCISRRRLARRKRLPRALGPWLLDSGGFSELSLSGSWQTTAAEYVRDVRRYASEIGNLTAAATQDWMCEPMMLQRTGLTIREHQERSTASLLELRSRAPELPWFPVLQGWHPEDYLRHVDGYERAGIDLSQEPLVGVGSVCRRQHAGVLEDVLYPLSRLGLRLHGFGVKRQGLARAREMLTSADSLAWSFHARRREPLPGCSHRSCANCLTYAMQWRADVEHDLAVPWAGQLRLPW